MLLDFKTLLTVLKTASTASRAFPERLRILTAVPWKTARTLWRSLEDCTNSPPFPGRLGARTHRHSLEKLRADTQPRRRGRQLCRIHGGHLPASLRGAVESPNAMATKKPAQQSSCHARLQLLERPWRDCTWCHLLTGVTCCFSLGKWRGLKY